MAIYHCSISNVSRSAGSSSCATLSYISGERIHDDRQGQTYNYGRNERVMEVRTILPEGAPDEYNNPSVLFNSIEKNLTASNARTAKKIEVALPNELPLEEQKTIVENYIRDNLTSQGYCATYAIHTDKDNNNPHAHILIPNRPINANGEWGGKSRKDYALDEEGNRIPVIEYMKDEKGKFLKDDNGKKIPVFDENGNPKQKVDARNRKQWKRIDVEVNPIDTKQFVQDMRKNWAEEVNKHLAPERHIDHRSHKERGLDVLPTIHEGYAAREIEKRGGVSDRCEMNKEIKEINRERLEIKVELENAKKEMELVERKEKDLHERMGRIRTDGRGKTDGYVGDFAEGERGVKATPAPSAPAPDDGTVIENNKTAGTRDWTAELIAHRRAITEREIARISQEREDAKRRKLEAKRENTNSRITTKTKERTTTKVIDTGRGFGR